MIDARLAELLEQSKGDPDECWPWPGCIKPDGYGRRSHGSAYGETLAHRIAYCHWVGPIPDGMTLDHTCHTDDHTCHTDDHTCHTDDPTCYDGKRCAHRACVNPAHLEPVTRLENTQRRRRALTERLRIDGGSRVCVACKRESNRLGELRRSRRMGRPTRRPMGTHCARGHELNEANLCVTTRGSKRCRVCDREDQQRKRRAAGVSEARPGFCRQGHPMCEDNLYVSPGGQRQCRACVKRRQQAAKVR